MDGGFRYVTQLAFGYWQSQVLFVICESGICDHLAARPDTAAGVAAALRLAPVPAEGVLNAAVALRLLELVNGEYRPSETTRRLLADGPQTLSSWVRLMGRWVQPWSRMSDVLRSGVNAESQAGRLGADPAYLREFILGIHQYAAAHADELAATLALDDARSLVDVGGGAGTFAIALCRRHPELRATIVDLEAVVPLTRETVAAADLTERIDTRVGDYRVDPFPAPADAVLLSNILHQESPDVCRSILQRSLCAVRPGGQVIVHGHFLNDDRVSPTFATLHNLSAFALWEGGRSYTTTEMTSLMRDVGFAAVDVRPSGPSAATLLLTGTRAT